MIEASCQSHLNDIIYEYGALNFNNIILFYAWEYSTARKSFEKKQVSLYVYQTLAAMDDENVHYIYLLVV